MDEQYFAAKPQSGHHKRKLELVFRNQRLVFFTDAGVFSKDGLDEGTRLLLDACVNAISGRVLDLGCGWGALGIIAKKLRPDCDIVLSDVNERACDLTRENALVNGVKASVYCGDGFETIPGKFDWILFNPPVRAGKQTIYSLFEECAKRLNRGGRLAVVMRKQQGALSALARLQTLFGQAQLVCRHKGFHVYFCGEADE